VAKQWREVCDTSINEGEEGIGPVLGTMRMTSNAQDSSGPSRPSFSLALDNEATKDLPQEYSMNVLTGARDQIGVLAFSDVGGKMRSEGMVQHRFETQPLRILGGARSGSGSGRGEGGTEAIDPAYRKMSRERHQAASVKSRTIQYSDLQITNLRKPVGATEAIGKKRKADSSKRVAMDAQDLQALLFKLFERQAHWKFSQLQQQTEQPTVHLKSALSEIAVQLKSGPYKDLWELRREFKTGNNEAS
jgi:hypothetical protein